MASFDPFGCAQDRLSFSIRGLPWSRVLSFRGAEGDEESFSRIAGEVFERKSGN